MAHVFVSYVRENEAPVSRLTEALRNRGIQIWRDRDSIAPGKRWKREIRRAITEGAFFFACFSAEYSARDKSYMNEELTIAIEELRQRPADRAWFVPIVLSRCRIPDRDIGGGETLRDIQRLDLSKDWQSGVDKLLKVVLPQASRRSLEGRQDDWAEAIEGGIRAAEPQASPVRKRPLKARAEPPEKGAADQSTANVAIIREGGTGRSHLWEVSVTEIPADKEIALGERFIGEGGRVHFGLPAPGQYSIQLSFSNREESYQQHGVVYAFSNGKSNIWAGILSPGNYTFECGPDRSLLAGGSRIASVLLTLGRLERHKMFLKLRSYEDSAGVRVTG